MYQKGQIRQPESHSSETVQNLALGSFHQITLQVHEITPSFSPLQYRARSGFPCDCPEPAGNMDLSTETEGPPLRLQDICSSSTWQTHFPCPWVALHFSRAALHMYFVFHIHFPCTISHPSLNCRKCH